MSQIDFKRMINDGQPITLDSEVMAAAFESARRERAKALSVGIRWARSLFGAKRFTASERTEAHA